MPLGEVESVRSWWQDSVCGAQNTDKPPMTREYFEEIERHRYEQEPFIFSFAQFTRYRGQKVLEVGVGAATDFLQWVRAGAEAHGVDLTEAGIDHARARLGLYGLEAAQLRTANAEALPYEANTFDLVYSWGVLHHSPDMRAALREVVRVTKPGGHAKIMLYHRRSLTAFYVWVKWALLKGRPWLSTSECLSAHVESPGTKAVTRSEVRRMLAEMGVTKHEMRAVATYQDLLSGHGRLATIGRALHRVFGDDAGWFLLIELEKSAQ